jgi:hypothetical protein
MSDDIDREISEALDAARAEISAYVEEAKDDLKDFVEDLKSGTPEEPTPEEPAPELPQEDPEWPNRAGDLAAWSVMRANYAAANPNLNDQEIDTNLNDFFTDIKEGRRDADGNPVPQS